MTILERRHPSRWARTDRLKHEGLDGVGKPQTVTPDTDEARQAIAAILAQAGALDHNQED